MTARHVLHRPPAPPRPEGQLQVLPSPPGHSLVVGTDVEEELAEQWQLLGNLLPAANKFQFKTRLEIIKELDWYKEGIQKYEDAIADDAISVDSGQKGMGILLAHSQACLQLAPEMESLERFQLLMTALSILLPIVSVIYGTVWCIS